MYSLRAVRLQIKPMKFKNNTTWYQTVCVPERHGSIRVGTRHKTRGSQGSKECSMSSYTLRFLFWVYNHLKVNDNWRPSSIIGHVLKALGSNPELKVEEYKIK